MARKHISLGQFAVSTEMDDGGVKFTHDYRQCDWHEWADGMSPGELTCIARAHAKVCDGKPQPKPERREPPAGYNPFVSSMWAEEIVRALQTSLAYGRPFVTGLPKL